MRKNYCCNYSILPVYREILWHVWHNLNRCALFLAGLSLHLPFCGIFSCEKYLPLHFCRIPINRNTFSGLTVLSWLICYEFFKSISGSFYNILFSFPSLFSVSRRKQRLLHIHVVVLQIRNQKGKEKEKKKKSSSWMAAMAASTLLGDGSITVLLCSGTTMFSKQNVVGCQL